MPLRPVAPALIVLGGLALCRPAVPTIAAEPGPPAWTWDVSAGYDSFTHTYALATSDTSETVSETMVRLGCEGRSRPGAADRWRLRLEGSAGSDLWREHLEADWRSTDGGGVARLRAAARLSGQQYRAATDLTQSSDQFEGRVDLQAVPVAGEHREIYLLGWGSTVSYAQVSPLEQGLREAGLGAGVRSRGWDGPTWAVAVRRAARTYPDSTAIDRHSWLAEADLHRPLGETGSLGFHGLSERRLAADPSVRPDAWFHWLEGDGRVPTAAGELILESQYERWDYGRPTEVYRNSWRLAGFAGLRRGDVLGVQWLLGPALERYDAGDAPETYTQAGVRLGVESYATRLSGTCTVEYGRRRHAAQGGDDATLSYTDFDYWRLWLLAEWRLGASLSLSGLGSWEPERHDAAQDDVSLGFASLRLVWRP